MTRGKGHRSGLPACALAFAAAACSQPQSAEPPPAAPACPLDLVETMAVGDEPVSLMLVTRNSSSTPVTVPFNVESEWGVGA